MTITNEEDVGHTLQMGDISMDELTFQRDNDHLKIEVENKGTITVNDYFTQTNQSLTSLNTSWGNINLGKESIKEAKSSWWWRKGYANAKNGEDTLLIGTKYSDRLYGANSNDILFGDKKNDRLYGDNGNDTLFGQKGNDRLYGEKGDDVLYGEKGKDTLFGDVGNDVLFGGENKDRLNGGDGNDYIVGGEGNDILEGGKGDDTYYFNLGDGQDTIEDVSFNFWKWNTPQGGEDKIVFGEGIEKADISFFMRGDNLSIKYGDKDTIYIKGQDKQKTAIERFELSDGSFMEVDDMEKVIQNMNAFAQDNGISLNSHSKIEKNDSLMQIVQSSWQNV